MSIFQEVKDHARIEDVYRDLVDPGFSFQGKQCSIKCPLPGHDDSNPSASVNRNEKCWYCHKCDDGGSVIDLVMKLKGLDSYQAIEWLIDHYNLPISQDLNEEEIREQWERKEQYEDALNTFVNRTHDNLTEEHREHLRDRGLSDQTIDELKIGYEPNAGPVDDDNAKQIGALNEDGVYLAGESYIIPIRRHDRLIYWMAYSPTAQGSQYIKPVERHAHLKQPLWGKETSTTQAPNYIVEGVFDQLSMIEADIPSTALLGTNPSNKQRSELRKLQNRENCDIRIMLDDDEAGYQKSIQLAERLWPEIEAEIVEYPGRADDPNELLIDSGASDQFRQTLEQSNTQTLLDIRLNKVAQASDEQKKLEEAENLYPLLADLKETEQDYYVEQLYEELDKNVRKSAIRRSIQKAEREKNNSGPERFFDYRSGRMKFVPRKLCEELLNETSFLNVGEQLYRYQDGVFRPDGERYLSQRVQDQLQDRWSNHYWREVKTWIEQKTDVDPNDIQPEKTLVNVKNGMLDIESDELTDHRPSYRSLIQHPVYYDPDVTCPQVDEFVQDVVPDSCVQLIWDFLGYCLLRPLELKKVLVLTGEGNNGKSALLDALFEKPLGPEFISHESLQQLAENRFSPAQLFGKVANIHADLEAKAVQQTGLLKQLTGGDTIRAERKMRDTFNFKNHARLIFSANELPVIRDFNEAFFNRLLIVPCPNRFEGDDADPEIVQKLTTDEAQSHILNRAIEGAKRLLDRKQFSVPSKVEKEVRSYQADVCSVTSFLKNQTESVDDDSDCNGVPKEHLYAAYRVWCQKNGYSPVKKSEFGKRANSSPNELDDFRPKGWENLQTLYSSEDHGERVRSWKGIVMKSHFKDRHLDQIEREAQQPSAM